MDVSFDRPKWKCLHQSDLPLINSKRAGTIILYQVQLCGVDRQDVWHTRAARGLLMRLKDTQKTLTGAAIGQIAQFLLIWSCFTHNSVTL